MVSANLEPVLLFYGLIFVVVVRRSVMLTRGVPVSLPRLVSAAVLYLLLFGLTVVLDLFVLPIWSLGLDLAVVVAGVFLATGYVARVVTFHPGTQGGWTYRLGLLLPMIYLGLYAVRIAVDLLVLNIDPFAGPGSAPTLSTWQLGALLSVNALFSLSAGMLVGRSIGVWRAFGAFQRAGAGSAPSSPGRPGDPSRP